MKRRSRKRKFHHSRNLRFESLEYRRLLAADWGHNVELPEDVNASNIVTPVDALVIINYLNNQQAGNPRTLAEGEAGADRLFMDVNDDLLLTPVDALMVINRLNRPEAETSQDFSSSDSATDSSLDQSTASTHLKAYLQGTGTAHGEAEYELEDEHGLVERQFETEIEHADPNMTYEVLVDDVPVGQLTTDNNGRGTLKLSTNPESNELPMPDDFPEISAGSTVRVGAIAAGTFQGNSSSSTEMDHDSSSDDKSDDYDDQSDDSSDDKSDDDSDDKSDDKSDSDDGDDHSEMELEARLVSDGPSRGEAEYETEVKGDATEREFEVEVEHGDANTTYEVLVDGSIVGLLTTDSEGEGKLKFATTPGDDEQPMPDDFPVITAGTSIAVGDILTGKFSPSSD